MTITLELTPRQIVQELAKDPEAIDEMARLISERSDISRIKTPLKPIEFARATNIGLRTVYNMISAKQIETVKGVPKLLIKAKELERFIK